MSGISDEELKQRLEAHNIRVPPITATTRGLLQKKLSMLDEKSNKFRKGNLFPSIFFQLLEFP